MTNRCIKNLLKLICLLQDNSKIDCLDIDNCTRPFFGQANNYIYYNTRVISLYTKKGNLFTAEYMNNNTEQTSSIFKVISVDDNTAKLLILNDTNNTIISTNNYITIKLSCIGAIRCLQDIAI